MNSLRITLPLLLITCLLSVAQGNLENAAEESNLPFTSGALSPALARNPAEGRTADIAADSTRNPAGVFFVPDDPYYVNQWPLPKVRAFQTPLVPAVGDREILVAILDTGIDLSHEDLQGRVIDEIDLTGSGSPDDINGHGTHVAGIIAANTNNGKGIAGVAPEARLLNVKVADDRGRCLASTVAKGIIWAVERGAMVINVSLEIRNPTPELRNAVNYAWENGVMLVAAGSNENNAEPVYPAYYRNSLSAVATRPDGSVGPLTGYPDWLDVAAPGFSVFSTLPGNSYGYKSGTSFATAYVSGLAALLFTAAEDANHNGRLNDEVRNAIENGAVTINDTGPKQIDIPGSFELIR